MKKILPILAVVCMALPSIAEKLVLTYGTTVTVFDDDGKRIGTRKLQAGTEITMVSKKITKAEKVALALSGFDPEDWLKQKGVKKPAVFFGDMMLVEKAIWPNELGKPGKYRDSFLVNFIAATPIKNNTDIKQTPFVCFPSRRTDVGKQLWELLKDNEPHSMLVRIMPTKDTKFKNSYVIDAFETVDISSKDKED